MNKVIAVAASCTAFALLGSGAAMADNETPSSDQVASQQCVAQQHAMGTKAFKALYGKRAMQTCKGKQSKPAKAKTANAAQTCKAEQADPNFPAAHGGMTFDQVYGTNKNQNNSFGKCVSGKVRESQAADAVNLQNAAQTCRAERADPAFAASHDGKTFTDYYGSNKSKKNAFGKCVSRKAHEAAVTPPPTDPVPTV
jgi:hypothetical protein